MRVIGLTGYAQAGKSTIAGELEKLTDMQRRSFADGVRSLAYSIDPWILDPDKGVQRLSVLTTQGRTYEEAKKLPEVRRVLQEVGVSARRILGEDVWVNCLLRSLDFGQLPAGLVIDDVRFPNEADALRRSFDALIVRVTRPGTGPVNDHISERAMARYTVDLEIENTGTPEEAARQILHFVDG